jgi:hypothetical protein
VDGSASSLQSLSTDKWVCCLNFHLITDDDIGNRFILQSSLQLRRTLRTRGDERVQCQKKNPEFFLPMALAITFPFNITFECLYTFP